MTGKLPYGPAYLAVIDFLIETGKRRERERLERERAERTDAPLDGAELAATDDGVVSLADAQPVNVAVSSAAVSAAAVGEGE